MQNPNQKIQEKIKHLQRVQAKINLYNCLQANLCRELEDEAADDETRALAKEFPGLLKEFVDDVSAFCEKQMTFIAEGLVAAAPEIRKVPELVDEPVPVKEPKKPQPPVEETGEPTDPLRFLLKYRHLDSKKVSFKTKDGEIIGTVRGLGTPFITVETDMGYVVKVAPSEVKVL